MAASKETIQQVLNILIEELGRPKAAAIIIRLRNETTGNTSYQRTINNLYDLMIMTNQQLQERNQRWLGK